MRYGKHSQLWLFLIGVFFQTAPGAMLAPFLALTLAARGVDPALIGAFATAPALAVMAALVAAPALIRRFGERRTFRAAVLGSAAATLAIVLADAPLLWAPLFTGAGFAAGLRFAIAEAWAPAFAAAAARGRALALYQTAVGAALFAGSGALLLVGVDGLAPRGLAAVATLLGAALLWRVRAPAAPTQASPAPGRTARAALALVGPCVLSAALLGGLFESGMGVALPLYGLAGGLSPALATGLVTAMGLGSLAQYPFGYLADRYPWRRVALGTAGLVAGSALLLPLAAGWPALLVLLGVLWGAAGGGLYTLASIHNAARWRGSQLVGASVVTQFAYMVGEATGPALGGLALGLAPARGLPLLVGAAGLAGLAAMIAAGGQGSPARAGALLAEPEAA